MSIRARRKGREEAFRLVFEADQGVTEFEAMMALAEAETPLKPEAFAFARELAAGTWAARATIDPLLADRARGWTLERMAAADRAILRLAAYELLHRADTPVSVTINEAVELAKRYGTDDSPKFINGILGALARDAAEHSEPSDDL